MPASPLLCQRFAILDAMPSGTLVFLAGNCAFVNRIAAQLLGMEPDQANSSLSTLLQLQVIREARRLALECEKGTSIASSRPAAVYCDSVSRWLEFRASYVEAHRCVLVFIDDVTSRQVASQLTALEQVISLMVREKINRNFNENHFLRSLCGYSVEQQLACWSLFDIYDQIDGSMPRAAVCSVPQEAALLSHLRRMYDSARAPQLLRRQDAPTAVAIAWPEVISHIILLPLIVLVRDGEAKLGSWILGCKDHQLAQTAWDSLASGLALLADRVGAIVKSQRREQELHAVNLAKDQCIAVLSHELRTPLTPALLLLDTLLDIGERNNGLPPQQLIEDLGTIRESLLVASQLMDDLLDTTRMGNGKFTISPTPTNLHDIIHNAVRVVEHDARVKRLTLQMQLNASRVVVNADPRRLLQVFWNVLKNAVKFTPDGGRIEIQTEDVPNENCVRIHIRDTGMGIDYALLPRLFEPYAQADSVTKAHGGLGLGLPIAHHIVHLHHGTITASSEGPGHGACFSITLPLHRDRDDGEGGKGGGKFSPVVSPQKRSRRSGGTLRILLVEDNHSSLLVMQRILAQDGHAVTSASSQTEALAKVTRETFDLVISDIGLPDGDGRQLMRILKERYRLTGIALSGYATESDAQRSIDAGFRLHLTKPVRVTTLREAIACVARESGMSTLN